MLISSKYLYCLGTKRFEVEYTHTNVFNYLLARLLISNLITPKELADELGIQVRKAQRLVYNESPLDISSINLDSSYLLLDYMGYDFARFFTDIQNFINSKAYAASYLDNELIMISSKEYELYNDSKDPDLIAIIQKLGTNQRLRSRNFTKYELTSLFTQVSLYTSTAIRGVLNS